MSASRRFFELAETLSSEDQPRHVRIAVDKDGAAIWVVQVHDPDEGLAPAIVFGSTQAPPVSDTPAWFDLEPWVYRATPVVIPATAGVAALQAAWETAIATEDPFAAISPERLEVMRSLGAWV